MKLLIPKSNLAYALRRVQGAISGRAFNPWMTCVLLKATELPASSGSRLSVSATNLDVQISHATDATVIEPGAALLPFERLSKHVAGFGPQDVELAIDENLKCSFACGDSKGSLTGMNPAEFTEFAPQERKGFTMERSALRAALRRTLVAVGQDTGRLALCGVLIELKENRLSFIAADGKMLAVVKSLFDGDGIRSIIPTKGAQEAMRLLEGDGEVSVLIGPNTAEFVIGETSVSTKLIDAAYPPFADVIPKAKGHRISVNREELLDKVKSVGWIVDPNKCARTTYQFSRNRIRLSQVSSSDANERDMAVSYNGPEMSFMLPPDQVTAILSVIDDDDVTMEIVDALTPTVLRAGNFTALMMPFRQSA